MLTSARRVAAILAAVISVLAVQHATACPAAAHAELATSEPAPGSTVRNAPASIRLTFTEAVAQPAAVAVRGPDGRTTSTGDADIADTDVTQALDDAGPGRYTVAYQVTSVDGHPIEGVVEFTVAGAPITGTTNDMGQDSANNTAVETSPAASAEDKVSAGVVAGLVAGLALALCLIVLGVRRLLRADG
jgi:methionine-rich copper-binding protein CopC